MDPRKIQVIGLNPSVSEDRVRFYIQELSSKEVEDVQLGTNGTNALVTFVESQDFDKIGQLLKKDKKGIEGCTALTFDPVPFCHWIQVSGLSSTTTEDTIKFYFGNARKGCGVEPTKVELQHGLGKAQLYFEDHSVIGELLDKHHELDNAELGIKLFYPFLGKAEQKMTREQKAIEVNPNIIAFIKADKSYNKRLQSILHDNSIKLAWQPGETSAQIEDSKEECSLGVWSQRVNTLLVFFDQFGHKVMNVDAPLWEEVDTALPQVLDNKKVKMVPDAKTSSVAITGKRHDVEQLAEQVKTSIETVKEDKDTRESIETYVLEDIKSPHLALLNICDFISHFQQRCRHVQMDIDERNGKVTIESPRNMIDEIKVELLKFSSKIDKEVVTVPLRIVKVLQSQRGSEYLRNALEEQHILAVVFHQSRPNKNESTVFGVDGIHSMKAKELIVSLTKEEKLPLRKENMSVLKSKKWKEFVSLQENYHVVDISLEASLQTLFISGIKEDVAKCSRNVEDELDRNTILHDSVYIGDGRTTFLLSVWKDKLQKLQNEMKGFFLSIKANGKDGEVILSGTRIGIEKTKKALIDLKNKICHEEVKVDKPGMKKFFKSNQGRTYIHGLEKKHQCIVELMEGLSKQLVTDHSTSFDGDSYTTGEGKKLIVSQGDLTEQRVDVIVNAANGELQHTGGLAGAIVRAGGQEIQDECNSYIKKNGSLATGQVMETGPGNLPCERIIHAVGPRWHSAKKKELAEQQLKSAILNCLEHAKDFKSIAIPAVSSGIFGFPRDLCATILIQTALDFLEENPECNLSEVRFTNIDDETVNVFRNEMRNKFGGESSYRDSNTNTVVPVKPELPRAKPKPKRLPEAQTKPDESHDDVTSRSISISVKVGDISQEKADILVNTTGKELNLSNNPCAKAFSKVAGPMLQQLCNNIAPVQIGHIGITQSAGGLKCNHVIHVVGTAWDGGKGEKVLREILRQCLNEADRRGAVSIGIPAIGTGVLGFPRDVVARVSFEETTMFSQKTPGSTVKEVIFVVYPMDQSTVQAFLHEKQKMDDGISVNKPLSMRTPSTKPPVRSRPTPQKPTAPIKKERKEKRVDIQVKKLCVQIEQGNILHETTDALATNYNGAAWSAISATESQRESYVFLYDDDDEQPSKPVVYEAGHLLRVKKLVISYKSTKKSSDVKRIVTDCLKAAEKHKTIQSISLPAIGTGRDLAANVCAKSMLTAVHTFSKTNPKSVRLIRIIVFQEQMFQDFKSEMEEFAQKSSRFSKFVSASKTKLRKVFRRKKAGLEEQIEHETAMSIGVYSGSGSDLKSAVRAFKETMSEKCIQNVITKEAISYMDDEQLHTLHSLERRLGCRITVELQMGRIAVEGLTEDVLEVVTLVNNMIVQIVERNHERTKAENIAKDTEWQYKTASEFSPYSMEANYKIETAFADKEETVIFVEDGEECVIDFARMEEKTTKEGVNTVTNVKRRDLRLDRIGLPTNWDEQPTCRDGVEKAVHLVDIVQNSDEYTKVSQYFYTTSQALTIVGIKRIQNPEQYKIYSIRKQKMDDQSGSNEKWLFHGTAAESCESINQTGFNRNYGGKNATVYGLGVYFAVDASYSARPTYSPPDLNGLRYMYLSRVLTGEYTTGKKNMKVPPAKNAHHPNDTYDTVVDNINNPAIFVVFYDGQAYPDYLITFR